MRRGFGNLRASRVALEALASSCRRRRGHAAMHLHDPAGEIAPPGREHWRRRNGSSPRQRRRVIRRVVRSYGQRPKPMRRSIEHCGHRHQLLSDAYSGECSCGRADRTSRAAEQSYQVNRVHQHDVECASAVAFRHSCGIPMSREVVDGSALVGLGLRQLHVSARHTDRDHQQSFGRRATLTSLRREPGPAGCRNHRSGSRRGAGTRNRESRRT